MRPLENRGPDERRQVSSKKRLFEILRKKFNTTMIGSLDSFEKLFGSLWGHGKQGQLTETEREWREVWQEARTQILDRGNVQLRAALDEMSNYTINWNRFRVDFLIKKENEDGRE